MIKRDPEGFFRWLLRAERISFHAWIDARRVALPDQGDLTNDLVAALRVGEAFEALCVEVEAESEDASAGRLLYGYLPRLRTEEPAAGSLALSAVGGVVLNLTGPAQRATVTERPTTAPESRFDGSVTQRTVRQTDAAELLGQVAMSKVSLWLLALLPLMRSGKAATTMAGWKRAAAWLGTERDRGILARLTLTFAGLAGNLTVWRRALEGWTMLRSEYMDELRIQERLEAMREVLLGQGRKKFGRAPTKRQQAEIDAITAPEQVKALTERLLDVTTWAELLAAPRENGAD